MPTPQGCIVSWLCPALYPQTFLINIGFVPGSVFDYFYRSAVKYVEKSVGLNHLTEKTREIFVRMANENFLKRRRSATTHLETMGTFAAIWKRCHSRLFCFFCLVRGPNYSLDCGHGLCRPCLVICGEASATETWTLAPRRCPLCSELNRKSFQLRPLTASRRMLILRGGERHRGTMMQFLKDLQSQIGLTTMHICDHFDILVGSDIGQQDSPALRAR